MGKFIVRAVDSGNIQRSPTFQAVFNHGLSITEACPVPIMFDSAGIDVNDIIRNKTPALKKLSILDAGLHYDLIEGKEKDLAQKLVERWIHEGEERIPDGQKNIITGLYAANKDKIHALQMKYRNEALLDAGIPKKFLPGMRVPFRSHKDLRLVLPVESKVLEKVENYYQNLGKGVRKPIIILYGDIADSEPLPDKLKGGMKTAREQVEYFMSTRKKVMEKIAVTLMPHDGC